MQKKNKNGNDERKEKKVRPKKKSDEKINRPKVFWSEGRRESRVMALAARRECRRRTKMRMKKC